MMKVKFYIVFAVLAGFACSKAAYQGATIATYLANEAVMVTRGEVKILFDPLFEETFGQYQALPVEMKTALMEGRAPFDDITAIFISHSHDDHFSAAEMLMYLRRHPNVELFAPQQAILAMQDQAEGEFATVKSQIQAIDLEYGDPAMELVFQDLQIEAVRIPHAGWPAPRRAAVQNISYRVTLANDTTVVHMGDADPNDIHFARNSDHWAARQVDMAFPPYWFFMTKEGNTILQNRVQALKSVGIHTPAAMPVDPSDRPYQYQGFDIFVVPGASREFSGPSSR